MKKTAAIIIGILMALAAGCGAPKTMGSFDGQKGIPQPVNPAYRMAKPQHTVGSLFVASQTDYFTDLRASKVGDLVMVQIVENDKANKKNDTKAERNNTFSAGIPNLFGYEFRRGSGESNKDPLVSADFKSKHDAKAKITREDSVTATIGCTVIEVMPSGNLVIRGSKEVLVAQENETITLQGIIRPSDITASNSVLSTQIADAKIWYTGRGVLSDKNSPGWLARLLDHIWPF